MIWLGRSAVTSAVRIGARHVVTVLCFYKTLILLLKLTREYGIVLFDFYELIT